MPGNANLAPIESDHLVGGVKYEPSPGLLVSAEVYRKWYRAYPVSLEHPQLTLANHGSEFNTSDLLLLPMTSDGKGRVRGLEFFLKKRLAAGLYGQIAYSWSRTGTGGARRHLPPRLVRYAARDDRDRRVIGSANDGKCRADSPAPAAVRTRRRSCRNRWIRNCLVYDVARFNEARLPAFHRLDVRIDRKFKLFGRNTSLFADMQNRTIAAR